MTLKAFSRERLGSQGNALTLKAFALTHARNSTLKCTRSEEIKAFIKAFIKALAAHCEATPKAEANSEARAEANSLKLDLKLNSEATLKL